MKRRLVAALAASVVLVAALLPASVAAASSSHREFRRLDISKVDPKLLPSLASSRQTTAILELAAKPAQARPGLTKAQKLTVAKQLKATQDKLVSRITGRGGKVLAKYQYAYNGIRVRGSGAAIASMLDLPGVVGVHSVRSYTFDNVHSVPFIGAPVAWEDQGVTGDGQTIAVIDTGLDYTHADFGGPGTTAAFDDNDGTIIEPGSFPTTKVIDGWDFVGDDYDADGTGAALVPHPDPDPLDCFGHGTHVAGTAAGQGVLDNGDSFEGPYNESTHGSNTFLVGPGVAPEAKLVALRVFGCEGSSNVIVDALDWVAQYNLTHPDAIDVVNMSLGAPFGKATDPDAVASDNLVASGVVVVAAAGNAADVPFIHDSPGVASRVISAAAEDTLETFPSASIDVPTDPDIPGISMNAHPDLPVTGTLHVLDDGSGGVLLGCDAADYDAGTSGKIVAVKRGVCAFVDKGALAEAAGAIGIVVINRDDLAVGELPPFIGYSPDEFDIPMVGVAKDAQPTLLAHEGDSVTLNSGPDVANPTFTQYANFTSAGPRNFDNASKPDVTAPGVSILSALSGGGTAGTTLSGTSMATPHTAGTVALIRQAHPTWTTSAIKAVLMNTATVDGSVLDSENERLGGAGLIQPSPASSALVFATTGDNQASLSYGYDQQNAAYSEAKTITFWNTTGSDVDYDLSSSGIVDVSPTSITIPAHGSATVDATASLTVPELAATPSVSTFAEGIGAWGVLNSYQGAVVADPASPSSSLRSLRIPYQAVPRAISKLEVSAKTPYVHNSSTMSTTSVTVTNNGIHTGFADLYSRGQADAKTLSLTAPDIRAVGVQTLPAAALTGTADPNDRGLIFAVNSWNRWGSAAGNEIDIAIYRNHHTTPDYTVVGVDFGAVTADAFNGQVASFIINKHNEIVDAWVADAPNNGSTFLLPALASDFGLTSAHSTFEYRTTSFDLTDATQVDTTTNRAFYDAFHWNVTTGNYAQLDPGEHVTWTLRVRKNVGPLPLGWMVVGLDDANGSQQADIVSLGNP